VLAVLRFPRLIDHSVERDVESCVTGRHLFGCARRQRRAQFMRINGLRCRALEVLVGPNIPG
jgi:hypothetical protein